MGHKPKERSRSRKTPTRKPAWTEGVSQQRNFQKALLLLESQGVTKKNLESYFSFSEAHGAVSGELRALDATFEENIELLKTSLQHAWEDFQRQTEQTPTPVPRDVSDIVLPEQFREMRRLWLLMLYMRQLQHDIRVTRQAHHEFDFRRKTEPLASKKKGHIYADLKAAFGLNYRQMALLILAWENGWKVPVLESSLAAKADSIRRAVNDGA